MNMHVGDQDSVSYRYTFLDVRLACNLGVFLSEVSMVRQVTRYSLLQRL